MLQSFLETMKLNKYWIALPFLFLVIAFSLAFSIKDVDDLNDRQLSVLKYPKAVIATQTKFSEEVEVDK